MASPIQAQREVREFESTYPLYDGAGIVRAVLRVADRLTQRRVPKGDENGHQRSDCPNPLQQLEKPQGNQAQVTE